jgi:hypothetical protein
MKPTYKIRLLRGDMKSRVPTIYRVHLLIDGQMYNAVEGVKHLGPEGATLIATPHKACYGPPLRMHVDENGRILDVPHST